MGQGNYRSRLSATRSVAERIWVWYFSCGPTQATMGKIAMTAPTLLREGEVSTHFRKLAKGAKIVAVAASFWGKNAATKLGLSKKDRSRARILCNLDQIGCNPRAIKELFDLGLEIRSHRRLRAKIYAASKFAICRDRVA
jgi:hypothetical protein